MALHEKLFTDIHTEIHDHTEKEAYRVSSMTTFFTFQNLKVMQVSFSSGTLGRYWGPFSGQKMVLNCRPAFRATRRVVAPPLFEELGGGVQLQVVPRGHVEEEEERVRAPVEVGRVRPLGGMND